jgi:peptidoglycan/xylan/chitin deacetylase (PgdA/CDA1 family)
MDIALKIDVDTYRGTLEGVPRLSEALATRGISASFYFSLGPDHTGWALRRVFRPGFLAKVQRTSVVSHYGLRTLLYGVLLPGPHIARKASHVLKATAAAGHETGIHCYDHVYWQDNVATREAAWTKQQVDRAVEAYFEVFKQQATSHCAAGWQVNPHLLALEDTYRFSYASDCRGTQPFLPVMGEYFGHCPQLPTTLPTLDELIGVDGNNTSDAVDHILALSETADGNTHVFTLHAELEGQQLLPEFLRLVDAWQSRGHRLVSLASLRKGLDISQLPRHELTMGMLPGRSGTLALQGPRV